MTGFQRLYGTNLSALILTETQLAELQDAYRSISDEELYWMVCPTETIQ
jgi:hypothetical protein